MPDSGIKKGNTTFDLSTRILEADRKGALLVSLPKWIAWVIIAWQIRLSIEALTGKYAFPSLLTRFWRQASVWEVACWGACILGLMFGIHSRYLLHKQISRDLSRMDSIEKRLEALAAVSGNPKGTDDRSAT
jgi:hypothetical protein